MTLIDTHTHAWGPETDEYPWQAAVLPPGWNGSYTHDALVADMDDGGVDEGVIVTTPLYGRGSDANEYTLAAIDAQPDRLWGVGVMDFFPNTDASETVREQFEQITDHERMLGVRIHAALSYAPTPTEVDRHGTWFLDEQLEPMFTDAAREDVAVFLFPKAQQLASIEELIDAHPEVQFIIDHMAWPDETTTPHTAPWTRFESIAEHPNVAVKVSSLPRSSNEAWPYSDLHPYVRNLFEWFGPERLMIGSDYPWMDDWATYEECLSWIEAVEFLSNRDRAYLTHRTFDRIHRD